MKKEKAFTLIELLVVMAIIALLTVFLAASIMLIKARVQDTRIMAEISQIRKVAELMEKSSESYENLCDDGNLLNKDEPIYGNELARLEDDIKVRQGGNLDLNCQASKVSYCLDVNLMASGSGRYCIDDEGHSIITTENFTCSTATTTCQ
ncbi:type II secretion system GspH family protein [Patescibacteria group bacterium]|nr:type II secretion system GspH family protein [Patescibacteria group bacterium]MBU4481355.1 type II secretion system GspH family protein [Patescibacteria group bacterium]